MYRLRTWIAGCTAIVIGSMAVGAAQQTPPAPTQAPLPLEPQRERGASVTPAYEGWYQNPDGSFSLLIGYFNRNRGEALDIPVGPNNKIEPGEADQGQPTHFEIGRQWGVFVIKVPKDFGNKAVTWTIVSNGEKQSIPFTLNKGYPITPFKELGMNNQPPVLSFSQGGPKFTGPPTAVAANLTAKVNQPTPINIWAEDPKSPLVEPGGGRGGPGAVATLSVHKFRGPGAVKFDRARVPVTTQGGQATVTATFSAPGNYTLRVQANDESGEGGGGFQCCWTNAYVRVAVQ